MVPVALLAALALADAGDAPVAAWGRSAAPAERTFQVGQIFITGHEDMVVSVILDRLEFRPGDVVTDRTLRQAERRLADLGLFVVDPIRGVRPQITAEERGRYTNVTVDVVEKKSGAR